MSAQLQQNLFSIDLYVIPDVPKTPRKRIRYKTPTYTKKYRLSWQDEEAGEWFYDSDEKHIFRIKDLQKIHLLIYGYCGIDLFEQAEKIEKDGITCWIEDKQAEIQGTWNLPLKDRVLIHLNLLRLLRQGIELKKAVEIAKRKTKTVLQ